MPLRVTLNDQNLFLQQLTANALVGFDQHKRNLQARDLVYHRAPDLPIPADNKVIAQSFDADVVNHSSPGLHTLAVENRDQHSFRNPDLESEYAEIHKDGKKLRGIADLVGLNRVRMNHPEQRVLPAHALKVPVHQDTHQTEAKKN